MGAAKFNLTGDFAIEEGIDWKWENIFYEDDGSVWNLEDYEAEIDIRNSYNAEEAIVSLRSLSPGTGITIEGVTGYVLAEIDHDTSKDFDYPNTGVYDLILVSPSGLREAVLYGDVEFKPRSTKIA